MSPWVASVFAVVVAPSVWMLWRDPMVTGEVRRRLLWLGVGLVVSAAAFLYRYTL